MPLDIQQLLAMLNGQQGAGGQPLGGQGTGLLSNVSPPAPLSGLNFADSSVSGTTSGGGSLGGAPGQGVLPGQPAGPGLDLYQLLAQAGQGDQGGSNPGGLLSAIGGSDFTGIQPQNFGQQEVPGQRGGVPMQGTFAGQTGGDLDSLALIQQALGLIQKSGIGGLFSGTPDLGTRGDVAGGSLGDIVRESETAGGGGGGINPSDVQAGGDAEGTSGGPTGQQIGGGISTLQGLLGLAQGIQGGNVAQGVGGALGAGGGLSKLLGEGSLGSAFGGLSGLEGLIQGIRGDNPEQAVQGAAGLYGGLSGLDLAPSVGSLAGSAAEGLGMTGALEGLTEMLSGWGGAGALGAAGGMILPVIMAMFNPDSLSLPFAGHNRTEAVLRDTRNIRKNFGTAEGQVLQGQNAYDNLAGGAPINQTDLQNLYNAWSGMGGPALSQYFGTSGGAAGGIIKGTPQATLDAQLAESRQAQDKSYWGLLAAMDEAARSGQSFSNLGPMALNPLDALKRGVLGSGITDPSVYANGPNPTGSLGSMLWGTPQIWPELDMYGNLAGPSQGAVAGAAPESFVKQFTPGNYLNAVNQFFQPYNANLAASPFGKYAQPFMGNYAQTTPEQQQNMNRVAAEWQRMIEALG